MLVPQVGQASSGNARPRRGFGELRFLAVALVLVVIPTLLVKRDHNAVRPQCKLHVEYDSDDPGVEDV